MITVHRDIVQGSDEWLAARCGLLTASEMGKILTPTLKQASNEAERAHLWELLAQRITGYVEPHYCGDEMMRGQIDEHAAIDIYQAQRGLTVERVGIIINDEWGFRLGYSPDGMVGDDGLVEVKSRRQRFAVQTFVECVTADKIMPEFMLQAQTGLLVSGRDWLDHITFCGGLPMSVIRVFPDADIHKAILAAAEAFEARLAERLATYRKTTAGLPLTERTPEDIMFGG